MTIALRQWIARLENVSSSAASQPSTLEGELAGRRVKIIQGNHHGQTGEARVWDHKTNKYTVALDAGGFVTMDPNALVKSDTQRAQQQPTSAAPPQPQSTARPSSTPAQPSNRAPTQTWNDWNDGVKQQLEHWWFGLSGIAQFCVMAGAAMVLWVIITGSIPSFGGASASSRHSPRPPAPPGSRREGSSNHFDSFNAGSFNRNSHFDSFNSRNSYGQSSYSSGQSSWSQGSSSGLIPLAVFAAVAYFGYQQGWSVWTIMSMAQMASSMAGGGRMRRGYGGGYGGGGGFGRGGGFGMRRGW